MRTLLTLILVFTFSLFGLSQHSELTNIQMLSSSPITSLCDSTIGPIYQSATPIPTYGYLESNGYCYFLPQPQISFTLCFHFVAISNGVYLNSGFTALGCSTVTFTSLQLCDRTDNVIVGQGQFFNNLIVGHEYVWCVVGTTSGLFCQGLTTICPYWTEASLLPVELTLFTATPTNNDILLRWTTMSESNSDYFILEKSKDLYTFVEVARLKTSVYSNRKIDYEFLDRTPYDGVSYYRLVQVDLNGARKIYDPIFANITFKKPVRVLDVLGNSVDMNYNGLKILIFDDGSAVKYY
jgi:hypothetical protein